MSLPEVSFFKCQIRDTTQRDISGVKLKKKTTRRLDFQRGRKKKDFQPKLTKQTLVAYHYIL